LFPYIITVNLQIEVEREDDGRWLTEAPELPGVLAYGQTREEAIARVKALALRVMARNPAFHKGEEIGPRMLARIARRTGLTREDL